MNSPVSPRVLCVLAEAVQAFQDFDFEVRKSLNPDAKRDGGPLISPKGAQALMKARAARTESDGPLEKYLRVAGVMPPLQPASAVPLGEGFDAVMARLVQAYAQTDIDGYCRASGRSRHAVHVWKNRKAIPPAVLLEAGVVRGTNVAWLRTGIAK